MKTRQSKRERDKKKHSQCGEDFVLDRIVMDDMTDSAFGLDEIVVIQHIDLIDHAEAD